MFLAVAQDFRDRFSGAVEAFSRRNSSGHGYGDHSRHRLTDDAPSSKDVVSVSNILMPIVCKLGYVLDYVFKLLKCLLFP